MVRVVTGRAGHDAESHGVHIGLYAVGMLVLVAVETDLGLRRQHRYRVGRRVDAVTIGAGDVVALVHAAGPGQTNVPGMTAHADRVLVLRGRAGFVIEADDWRVAGAASAPSGMIAAGAMAALALLGRERCIGIRTLPMSGTKNKQHALVVVAGQAGIGADIILLRLGSGSKKEQKDE